MEGPPSNESKETADAAIKKIEQTLADFSAWIKQLSGDPQIIASMLTQVEHVNRELAELKEKLRTSSETER